MTEEFQQAEESLLELAADILRRHTRSVPNGARLSTEGQKALADYLTALATADAAVSPVERRAAIAFAHRVVDDDHPELSPLWMQRTHLPSDAASVEHAEVPDPRALPDDGLGQGPAARQEPSRHPHMR